MNVRVGIHVGDIVFDDGDVYGDGVNVASRLESMSPVGGICVSNTVYDELRNKKEFDGVELGLQSLKGVGRLIEIYGLKGDLLTEPKPSDYQDNKIAVHSDDEVPSIAIIPFENKGKEEDGFYAYGISADLISDCSGAGLIRVAGLKEVEELGDIPFKEKAEKLFVRYVATGSLWKMDDKFQLNIELYDTKESKVIWADRWQEEWDNLPSIKGNLSDGILKTLDTQTKLDGEFTTSNTEAYEYYLKGRHKWNSRNSMEEGLVANSLLEKAIELDDNLMDAKNLLAKRTYDLGNFEKSMNMFGKNIKQARKQNDEFSIARIYEAKGWIFWEESKYEEAIESFSNAVQIFKKLERKKNILICSHGMGLVYTCIGQNQKTIEIYKQMKPIAKEIQDEGMINFGNNLIGIEYFEGQEYDKALKIFLDLISYADSRSSTDFRAWVYMNIGLTYYYKKEYNKSNEKFKIAYDITSKLGMLNETIWSLSWMILSGIKINKLDQSENLKFIHEKIDQSWLKDIDYPEINYVLSTIYLELQNSVKSKLHLDNAYKKLIEISKTIKNKEYKHSFLRARFHNEIVEAWEQNN